MLSVAAADATVCAQGPAGDLQRFWVSAGAGLGVMQGTRLALAGDLAYQREAQRFALHSTLVMGGYELSHFAASLGAVYGRASTRAGGSGWSAAAGLAFVQVDISGRDLENTVGIPITVQRSLDSPVVGIALVAFLNLNRAEPYAGALLSLRLGRLRRLSRSRPSAARARGPAAARTPRRYPALATPAPPR